MEARNLADLYDLALLDWAPIAKRLHAGVTQAPESGGPNRHTCWLATINADGSPHVTCVGALFVDGAVWFQTGERTRKGLNLTRDPRCSLSVATHDFDLMVEGEALKVTEPTIVANMANGRPRVGPSVWTRRAKLSQRRSAPPRRGLRPGMYRLALRTATVVATVEPGGATRWQDLTEP